MARHKWRGSRSSARASGECSASSPWRPRRSRRTRASFVRARRAARPRRRSRVPRGDALRAPSRPRGSCTWRTRSRWRELWGRVCRYRTDAGKKSWTSCSPRTCWRARSRRPRFGGGSDARAARRRRDVGVERPGAIRGGLVRAARQSRPGRARAGAPEAARGERRAAQEPGQGARGGGRAARAAGARRSRPRRRAATAAPRRGRCRRSWRAPRGACRGWWRAWTRWRRPRGRRTRTPRRLSGVCWRSTRPWAR